MFTKDFENSKILVVGGAGFVGSNLVRILLKSNLDNIVIVDNLLSSERFNIPEAKQVTFIEGSITNDEILSHLEDEYDYVFHLATFHGNQNSIYNPLADHENNTITTLKLYERIKNFKRLKKVVYSGAGCAVAEKTFEEAKATVETDLVSLTMDSPYSMSKIFGEFYSNYFFNQHGLPIVRARFQNVYGPGEVLGAGEWRGTPATVWRNVAPAFIYRALHKMPLPVENKGIATRDFIYVDDICRGLIACALKGKPGDVYNLASGFETTIIQLALLINELTDNPAGVEDKPKRKWDNSGKRFGSIVKSQKELDFVAKTPLRDGLIKTIDWTKKNIDLIKECINKHRSYL